MQNMNKREIERTTEPVGRLTGNTSFFNGQRKPLWNQAVSHNGPQLWLYLSTGI